VLNDELIRKCVANMCSRDAELRRQRPNLPTLRKSVAELPV